MEARAKLTALALFCSILKKHGVREWNIYDVTGEPGAASSRSTTNVAPAVNPTPTTSVDSTTIDKDPEVEIIDKRDRVR